jgi:hypothetical protein
MVKVQVPVPEHTLPLQPVKVEPVEEDAVKATTVLLLKADEQTDPQVMPAGLLVTVPLPAPVLLTVRVKVVAAGTNTFHASFVSPPTRLLASEENAT